METDDIADFTLPTNDSQLPPPSLDSQNISQSIDFPSSLEFPDSEVASGVPEDLISESPSDSCIETVRQLCRAIQTECAFPELLPSWTLSYARSEDEHAIKRLMAAWNATQESESQTHLSLNAVDRLSHKINEAAANKLTRCMQIYYLARLRKILHDPAAVVGLKEANPEADLVEERELAIARDWEHYIMDHEMDFAAATFTCVHVMAKPEVIEDKNQPSAMEVFRKYAAYGMSQEERAGDEMLDMILESLDREPAGSNPVMCLMCDRFRHGFYSCKLDARL
eukprot:Gregarina_sp_Pseudo_9__1261@NODE_1837_length_1301_cov_14_983360_g1704_i0_p1_GENE_NODE_1837_length_1301_cov_14_983360_g1704_i0NODE_1837_length_1301_cov_14_983360_g1704_i0_p1_ORF_typecomplete_len282_score39_36_NODE_1837_length_1301_cov_14_983360_g1704_i046891